MNKMITWTAVISMVLSFLSCDRSNRVNQQEDLDPIMAECVERAYQGDPDAQYLMGVCCHKEHSLVKAVEWYTKAAEQGHGFAQCVLGDCYYYGLGVEQSFSIAVDWYRKSAVNGVTCAQDKLADCYFDGVGVPKSLDDALWWYRSAATSGNIHSMSCLGTIYYYGLGVAPSPDSASYWFTMSANKSDSIALLAFVNKSKI